MIETEHSGDVDFSANAYNAEDKEVTFDFIWNCNRFCSSKKKNAKKPQQLITLADLWVYV